MRSANSFKNRYGLRENPQIKYKIATLAKMIASHSISHTPNHAASAAQRYHQNVRVKAREDIMHEDDVPGVLAFV
jgi:hypothetical protein